MTTQAQDTHPQDPIDAYTLHIEEMRRRPVPSGLAGLVHMLFVEFFTFLFMWMAEIAERNRKGTLPEVAPVAAHEPRARPADLRPRESGWVQQRNRAAASGGTKMHGQFEQPKINQPAVEQPAALPPPRQDRVQKSKISAGPAPARPRHVDDECSQRCGWPRWRGPGMVWTAEAGFVGFDSKKWALAGADTCDSFVTI